MGCIGGLVELVRAAVRVYLMGESLLEQGLIQEPWQARAGTAYVSTDDRVRKKSERR